MCGIAGFLDPAAAMGPEAATRRLAAMTDNIAHRGPDADGHLVATDGGGGVWLGLGHRRLSIIDLSPAGAQPMESRCGRFAIAFNGEIYNFPELRTELETQGPIAWRGHSDTEVLLEAIARFGVVATLERLDGMFAFALLDRRSRKLVLARDAFGEKPLAYGLWQGVLLFGSELRVMDAWPGFAPPEDPQARAALLDYGCIPAPLTIHRGIAKLPPASWIEIGPDDVRSGNLPQPRLWWDMTACAASARARPFAGGMEEAVDAVGSLLGQVTARRLMSDVPLGALLSGGIDSTLTTMMMQQASSQPVRSFTIGMAVPGYDESVHAEAVARHLGTQHETLMLTPQEMQAVVPHVAALYDEPFADSSQLPTYLVSRMARSHVTVALSGDGGDELFAGYNRHFIAPHLWQRLSRLPSPLRRLAGAALQAVPPGALEAGVRLAGPLAPRDLAAGRAGEKLHKLAGLLGARDRDAFHQLLLLTGDASAVLMPEALPESHPRALRNGRRAEMEFGEMAMLADSGNYLHNDVLAKVDRASMAASLETRTPFLNRELFALAWSLPMEIKADRQQGKKVLRELLYRHVPRQLVDRPKAGFAMPVGRWLRGPLADWAESLLSPDALRRTGVFDSKAVRRFWDEHSSGRRDHEAMIWSILMYQSWHDSRRGGAL